MIYSAPMIPMIRVDGRRSRRCRGALRRPAVPRDHRGTVHSIVLRALWSSPIRREVAPMHTGTEQCSTPSRALRRTVSADMRASDDGILQPRELSASAPDVCVCVCWSIMSKSVRVRVNLRTVARHRAIAPAVVAITRYRLRTSALECRRRRAHLALRRCEGLPRCAGATLRVRSWVPDTLDDARGVRMMRARSSPSRGGTQHRRQ